MPNPIKETSGTTGSEQFYPTSCVEKTSSYALPLLVGISSLVIFSCGLAGYRKMGSFANFSRAHCIAMMGVGGSGSFVSFAILISKGFASPSTSLVQPQGSSTNDILKTPTKPQEIEATNPQEIEASAQEVPDINFDSSTLKPFSDQLDDLVAVFSQIKSGALIQGDPKLKNREDFLKCKNYQTTKPLLSISEFVPRTMVDHLMKMKKNSAIAVKYCSGDHISNMEGALHTFVTPICYIRMVGDYVWKNAHSVTLFPPGQTRPVVMSAAIQPDFENREVMMQLLSLGDQLFKGQKMAMDLVIPSAQQKKDPKFRSAYDNQLRKHMIYYLTKDHALPAKNSAEVVSVAVAVTFLSGQIENPDFDISILKNKAVRVNQQDIISLEAFFMTYVHQLRNEFSALENLLPQGYIYTINPPSIFVRALPDGAQLGNRLQILAFKYLKTKVEFKNLQAIAFSDFQDKDAIPLLRKIFSLPVMKQSEVFKGPDYTYFPDNQNYAVVLHNNSDAFGQNIETERMTSLDGVLGSCSDAACVLRREQEFDKIF